jgi:hypothetical protein
MGLFDIFSGKSADNLRQAGQTAQSQLYGAGQTAQGAFNTAGANAQRDFSALGGSAGTGYGNVATQAGQTLDQGQAGAMPYYGQARGEYDGLNFAPDQYGSTMLSGYGTLADATGANGAEGLGRARSLFNATPGYQSGINLAVDQANRIGNARGVAVGNTIGDTTKLATTYADQNYGNFVNRLSPFANAPGQQLARDQATAGFGMKLAGARAGIDTGTGKRSRTRRTRAPARSPACRGAASTFRRNSAGRARNMASRARPAARRRCSARRRPARRPTCRRRRKPRRRRPPTMPRHGTPFSAAPRWP